MTATPNKPSVPEYRITIKMKTKTHPRKWIADVLNDCMQEGEELVDWDIQEVS